MKQAVWNTLHDGCIESANGAVPGEVSLKIGIGYLCEKLPTAAKFIMLLLKQCERLEFRPFDGNAITDLAVLGTREIEILSAKLEGNMVRVVCTDGSLELAYGKSEVILAEGTIISQQELEAAADKYWTEWSQKYGRNRTSQ